MMIAPKRTISCVAKGSVQVVYSISSPTHNLFDSGSEAGLLAAGVTSGVFLLLLILAFVFFFLLYKRKQGQTS